MLKAGFARVDVTPPLGNPLHGYFRERISDGVLDPLSLNALCVSNDKNTVVFIAADFLGIVLEEIFNIKKAVCQATGLLEDNIVLQALHQHTSCTIGIRHKDNTDLKDANYMDVLKRKFCDVAKMAMDDLDECEMSVTFKETYRPLSFVRRFKMRDGSTKTNPGPLNPEIDCPIGVADNTVRLVKFEREFKNDIALVNFSTHPDVIGGTKYSADWPGFVRRQVEAELDSVFCIVVNGAQGDVNHVDVTKPKMVKIVENSYPFCEDMARVITDTVIDIWDEAEFCEGDEISCEYRIVDTPTNTSGIERVEECKKLLADHYSGKAKANISMGLGEWSRIASLPDATLFQKVPLTVVKIGDFAIVGFGGEPFTDYATFARAAAPDRFVISACCTNGYQGYIPSKTAFDEGGYEASSSKFTKDVVKLIYDNLKDMLK